MFKALGINRGLFHFFDSHPFIIYTLQTAYCNKPKSNLPEKFEFFTLKRMANFHQKVGFSQFSILAIWATNSRTNSNPIFGVCILFRKVRKTPDFFRNPVFFMVAEAGLEPTTSGL
jgi:hypothetical protein